MFRGSNPAKVDAAGRLKIPSGFKALLDAANMTQLYITSPDGKSAQIWPLSEWEKREKVLMAHSTLNDAVDNFLNMTSFYGQQVEMDSQARVMLPPKLREVARLNAEVIVLGKVVYLEVRNEKEFEAGLAGFEMTAAHRKTVADLISQVS